MTIDTNTMFSLRKQTKFFKVTKLIDEEEQLSFLRIMFRDISLLSLVRRMKVRLHRMRMCLPYQKDC